MAFICWVSWGWQQDEWAYLPALLSEELTRSTRLGSLAATARTTVLPSSVVARAAAKSWPPIAARARRSRGAVTRSPSLVRSRVNTRSVQPSTFGTAARAARFSAARTSTPDARRKVRPASWIVSRYERTRAERDRAASVMPPACHAVPRCGSRDPLPHYRSLPNNIPAPTAALGGGQTFTSLPSGGGRVPLGCQAAAAMRAAASR